MATYSDGAGGTVTVEAAQFEAPAEAAAAYTLMVATLPAASPASEVPATPATPAAATPAAPSTGAVTVAGQPVGTWTVATGADGTGTAVWTNGTALFRAVGPAATVPDFYAAFPL